MDPRWQLLLLSFTAPQLHWSRPVVNAGFEASSSAGGRATNKALQLTHSSSAALTRATTVDDISSAFYERATIN